MKIRYVAHPCRGVLVNGYTAVLSGVTRGVWMVQTPPRNSEILTKYQKLRKFYYMK
jgi:hypothetical protein